MALDYLRHLKLLRWLLAIAAVGMLVYASIWSYDANGFAGITNMSLILWHEVIPTFRWLAWLTFILPLLLTYSEWLGFGPAAMQGLFRVMYLLLLMFGVGAASPFAGQIANLDSGMFVFMCWVLLEFVGVIAMGRVKYKMVRAQMNNDLQRRDGDRRD